MAKDTKPSPLLRLIVPLVALSVGGLVVLSLMKPPGEDPADTAGQDIAQTDAAESGGTASDDDTGGPNETPDRQADDTADADDATPPAGDSVVDTGSDSDDAAAPDADAEQTADTDDLDKPRPAFTDTAAALDEPGDLIALGSSDPADGYAIAARINPYRASIYDLDIVNEFHKVNKENQYKLISPISFDLGNANYPEAGTYAASYLTVNGQRIKLWDKDPDTGEWFGHWEVASSTTDKVTLQIKLVTGPEDSPTDLALITRTYRVVKADQPGSHTVKLTQQVENLSDEPLTITWEQLAQGGLYHATNDYLRGRSQQYVTGYFDLEYDPSRFAIYVEDGFHAEPDVVNKLKNPNDIGKWESVWPNDIDDVETKELAWLASENRYFVAISSAPADMTNAELETGDLTALQAIYPTITTSIYPNVFDSASYDDQDRKVILSLVSGEITLAPGKTSETKALSLDLFAGPREDAIFDQQPYRALQFEKTIRYSLGGMCGFCTFQWLAHLLLNFLEFLHTVTFDWGIAIVILVLVVRICLHPITKRGQINMMKMGKQMAAVQPELNKLKKKFADDPRQMQAAQMQLFREKGINPAAGALGCLPMFLQMPIWIALYAMLYYAIELRHEPAFFGVFQMFAGWEFLADLSSADRFIPLFADDGTHVWELIFIRLDYSSINLLPILMGVTFFINMKFTTPPPMNEQQATQQKIMKIMPLLFPFFLYSAPAGLTLYICASTLAGIVDSYIVRKHVKQMEESGELFKAKPRKSGGMMERLQKAAELRMQQAEEMKKQQQQAKNKGPSNYKKRKR